MGHKIHLSLQHLHPSNAHLHSRLAKGGYVYLFKAKRHTKAYDCANVKRDKAEVISEHKGAASCSETGKDEKNGGVKVLSIVVTGLLWIESFTYIRLCC